MKVNLGNLTTEKINENTVNIDRLSTIEIIELMNKEDQTVAHSVSKVLPVIAEVVDIVYHALKNGGRLFYVGAGTSGRIGILDAAECPPTFYTPPELVQALIAGGDVAVYRAVEGAEDNHEQGGLDLLERGLTAKDVVIGNAASGRTPYVVGALQYANQVNAKTVALSCNQNSVISQYANKAIEVIVGPEVLTGSTRLKAATAQKMVLNMISTSVMIKLGKVYGNLMVDLNASNEKLIERARNMIVKITGVSYEEATAVLNESNLKVKPAIVKIMSNVSIEDAIRLLDECDGFVHDAIELGRIRLTNNENSDSPISRKAN